MRLTPRASRAAAESVAARAATSRMAAACAAVCRGGRRRCLAAGESNIER
jgi:hypothetical protein